MKTTQKNVTETIGSSNIAKIMLLEPLVLATFPLHETKMLLKPLVSATLFSQCC
jgi:hypothetical protein